MITSALRATRDVFLVVLMVTALGLTGYTARVAYITELGLVDSQPLVEIDDALTGAGNVWRLDIAGVKHGTAFPISCVQSGAHYRVVFLSAGHCALDEFEILFFGVTPWYLAHHDDGRSLNGRFLARHESEDAAVFVFISQEPVEVRQIDFEAPKFGDKLFLTSYPGGVGPYLTGGRSSGSNRLSTSAMPGSSGGAVCRPDGSVCGILVAGWYARTQFVDFMVVHLPLASVEEWLRLYL